MTARDQHPVALKVAHFVDVGLLKHKVPNRIVIASFGCR